MTHKILIVEDDETIASLSKKQLENWGYDCHIVEDFKDVMKIFLSYQPSLVLLDISLPYFNGYKWCEEIRKLSSVPIIFVSSASDSMNIVMAMHMGADDFIAKPFAMDVLVAKVGALLRRSYDYPGHSQILFYHDILLNVDEASIYHGDQKIELTKNEFHIFHELLKHKNKIVSREVLMKRLWDTDEFVGDNTLSVNINRLRKTLQEVGLHDCIETKKAQGYLLKE